LAIAGVTLKIEFGLGLLGSLQNCVGLGIAGVTVEIVVGQGLQGFAFNITLG
jgi:hypothetical protein